ncbi:phage tail sheath protein FI [Leptolyngbyaceae cyanobacterium JSC-12]|nr:phage tail sheath protein FI [Leptolyngbyaceae cyanobacterium JSC-12]
MTQGISIPRNEYAFPNVSFTESIVGPIPFDAQWRNTIGVAGVFSRGPIGPSRITGRSEFAYNFGEDDSAGSLFIRQAMLQGATNFVVSRVMPNPARSAGSIHLQSGTNPTTSEAFVATGNARTVGMKFEASYVGSPLIRPGVYVGAAVRVDAAQPLLIPTYQGIGYFDFRVIEKVTNDVTPSPTVTVNISNAATTSTLQVVSASSTAGTAILNNAKPGRVLRVGTGGTGITFSSGAGQAYLQVVSYPFQISAGTYGVLVKGQVTGIANDEGPITIEASSVSDPTYFTVAYSYRSGDGSALLSNLASARTYEGNVGTADGFLKVSVNNKNYQNLIVYTDTSGTFAEVDTGIDIAIGNPGDSGATELVPTSSFSIPFMRGVASVGENNTAASGFPNTASAFASGLAAVEVLKLLQRAIATNTILVSMLDDISVNDFNLPYSLTFTSNFLGEEANRVSYKLTRTVGSGTPTDLQFQDTGDKYNTSIAMTGGRNAMTNAQLFLYDVNGNALVRIDAISPGKTGNSIRVTVRPIPAGQFRVEIVDETGINYSVPINPESFLLNNYSVDPQTGLYPETLDSKLIRAYFLPVVNSNGQAINSSIYALTPQRLAPPVQSLANTSATTNPLHPSHKGVAYLSNIYLKGGTEPVDYQINDPGEKDYVDAVRRLEDADCAIVALAGVSASDARYELAVTELTAQAERSTTLNGLRIAVISAPARVSEARASSVASGLSSDRVVIVSGYSTLVGARYLGVNSIPPIGIYTGLLANIPPHVSPASISNGQAAAGVLSVDSKSTPEFLDALTRARLEVLHYDSGLRLYKFLNGITTSNDPQRKYVSVRRMTDQIIMDMYRNLQWVRSAPNNRSLRARVASACDAYLRSLQREEKIYAWSPTICDESNNPIQDISNGRLNIRLTFTPIYPADFIRVNVVRDLTTEFSINTSAGA